MSNEINWNWSLKLVLHNSMPILLIDISVFKNNKQLFKKTIDDIGMKNN